MSEPAAPTEDEVHDTLTRVRALLDKSPSEALDELRRLAEFHPHHPSALAMAGEALRRLGEPIRAAQADAQVVVVLSRAPELVEAKAALDEQKVGVAERILRPFLDKHPKNPAAMSMLAGLAAKIGRLPDAEALLRGTLNLLPSFTAARYDLSALLFQTARYDEALKLIDSSLEGTTESGQFLDLKAAVLGTVGRVQEAVAINEAALQEVPDKAEYWIHYAHHLRAVGRQEDAVAAYRRALEIDPSFGDAWWSLANLKTVRLDAADAQEIRTQLDRNELSTESRVNMYFALAKALEDSGDLAGAFQNYSEGNALQRSTIDYRPEQLEKLVSESMELFTKEFFRERRDWGSPVADPIFIVGMPRAGSTLVEQIISSHPDVEATAELGYIPAMAMELRREVGYPNGLATLDRVKIGELADRYMKLAQPHRTTGRPFFIDKNPNNWMHAGLITLLLPNAKIVDVRRNPMACGLSNFRQLFARGQAFSYSLEDMGTYYARYVRYMRHIDSVLPARVHRVIYEDLVEDIGTQVRSLLDYLGLPFDEACLRFQDNDRAVRTPSSLQVRRPLYREGLEKWREFEPWLGPLKNAVGPLAEDYRS